MTARKQSKQEAQVEVDANPIGAMYTTDQVARMIDRHIRTVQRMIRDGELLAIGNKRYLKIPAEELARWKENELKKAREKVNKSKHKVGV